MTKFEFDGTTPEMQFWTNGVLELIRHCDGVFTLLHNGQQVMPSGPFDPICRYMHLEFDVL